MDQTKRLIEDIKNRKCYFCKNPLSVPPVMVVSEDGSSLRCGRCIEINSRTATRCTFYEDILKHLTFPCIYKNCNETIAWGQVGEHEKYCKFRTIPCPIYYLQCNELIQLTKLESHFVQKHSYNIQHGSISYNLKYSESEIILLLVDNEKFLAHLVNYYNQPFLVAVFSIEPSKRFTKFNVKLSSNKNESLFISCVNQNIIQYDEKKHCFKCLDEECTALDHPNSQVNYNKKSALHSRCVIYTNFKRNHFDYPKSVLYTINVIPDEQLNQKNIKVNPKPEAAPSNNQQIILKEIKCDLNNNLLRQNLECPVCKEYMLTPIFTCLVGHTICNACKLQVRSCPSCQAEIGQSRNYTLECISEGLQLPCQNEKLGCQFIGKVGKVREHELGCPHQAK